MFFTLIGANFINRNSSRRLVMSQSYEGGKRRKGRKN
jgi:hypothetical protein